MSDKTDEDENSGSGVAVVETNRFGFILGNGETDSDAPCPELVRHRETKWLGLIKQWEQVMERRSNKVKGQCQKGIPASVRVKCWPLLCGAMNRMKNNEKLYKRLVDAPDQQGWTEIIKRDTDRQFPFHEMFQSKDGHGQKDLLEVLKAYTQYRPDEGYCQAQGPVAAVLLMNMPAEEAFWCLAQISEHYLPGYYSPLLEGVLFDAAILLSVLKKLSPAAHKHLKTQGVEPLMFATDWLMCLYSRHLPFNTLLRVWDLFFCYGVRVLFQVAVVLVRRCLGEGRQRKECDGQMETLERLRGVKERVQNDQTDAFIHEVCSVPLSLTDLQKQTEKEMEKWKKERPDSTFDPRGRCHGYRMAWERVQNKQRETKKKEKGSLTLPVMRSHSSLSPSLLRKKWRKRESKTDTEEWDGGGRKFSQSMMEESDEEEMRRKSVCGVVGEERAKQDRLANEFQSHKEKDHNTHADISIVVSSCVEFDVFEEENEDSVCVSQTQKDSRQEDKLHTHRDNQKENTERQLNQQNDNSQVGQDKCNAERIAGSVMESKQTHDHKQNDEGETRCQDEQKLDRETCQDEQKLDREICQDEQKLDRETCQDEQKLDRETCQDEQNTEETCQDEQNTEEETCEDEQNTEEETCEDEQNTEEETCEDEQNTEEETCQDEQNTEGETCQDEQNIEGETCEDEQNTEEETCQDEQNTEGETCQGEQNTEKQRQQNMEIQITEICKEDIPATETSQTNYDPQQDIQTISGKQEEEIQSDSNYEKDKMQTGGCKQNRQHTKMDALQEVTIAGKDDKNKQNQQNTSETEDQTNFVQEYQRLNTYTGQHEENIHAEIQVEEDKETQPIGESLTDIDKEKAGVQKEVKILEEREITEQSKSTKEHHKQEIHIDEKDCDNNKANNNETMQTCEAVLTSSSAENDPKGESKVHPDGSVTVQGPDHPVQPSQSSGTKHNDSDVIVTLGDSDIPNSQREDATVTSINCEDGDMNTAATGISDLNLENSEVNITVPYEDKICCEVLSTEKSSTPESKEGIDACISGNPESMEHVGTEFVEKLNLKDGSGNLDIKEVHVTAESGIQESNNTRSSNPENNALKSTNSPDNLQSNAVAVVDGSGNPECNIVDSNESGNLHNTASSLSASSQELESPFSITTCKTPNIPPSQLCLRRTPSSRTPHPTILSEDTFREPKQMSTDHTHTAKQTNTPSTQSPVICQPEINTTCTPENTQIQPNSDLKTKTSTPKRLGLFRRLRGDTNKTPVPKILIQDFSEKEERLTSKERRRRKREMERKEKEEKERKKREKEIEKDKERERRKPQTRGKSFQVLNKKCADKDGSDVSQASHSRRNSAPFSDSYF